MNEAVYSECTLPTQDKRVCQLWHKKNWLVALPTSQHQVLRVTGGTNA